jgi:hypothetical protein
MPATADEATRRIGRAFGPGLRRAVVLALFFGSAFAAPAVASVASRPAAKSPGPRVDSTLVGTMARPALTTEGLAVEVETAGFHALITVSGPVVPGEGLPVQQRYTTCTWTVTMSHATGDVPVSLADFHAVDHLGTVYLPALVPGEHAPPAVLRPGRTLSFRIRVFELIGDGVMQWAPDHRHVVANWDYSVEND